MTKLGKILVLASVVFGFLTASQAPAQALYNHQNSPLYTKIVYVQSKAPLSVWPVNYAAWTWGQAVTIRFAPCVSGYACITAYHYWAVDNRHGYTSFWVSGTTKVAADIYLNTAYQGNASQRRATVCHELGHALGLDYHKTIKSTCMYGGTGGSGLPDSYDLSIIRGLYTSPSYGFK